MHVGEDYQVRVGEMAKHGLFLWIDRVEKDNNRDFSTIY